MDLKGLNNIPWYSQLGVFGCFGIIIFGLGWYFFISGLSEQVAIKQRQLEALKLEIQRGQAVEQKHQQFQAQHKQLSMKLSALKTTLPEAKQTDRLLRQIQESALSSNLTIKKIQPLPIAQKDFFSEWPINLEVEGNYHSLGIFLDKLSKFPRIVNVADLKIVENKKASPHHTITATCTTTTFVYNEEAVDSKGQKAVAKK